MVKRFSIVVGVILSLMVMVSCAKKAVKEEPLVTGKAEERALGKPGEEAERAKIEEKSLEASLEKKEYPGIEGVFLESSLLKDIHFGFDRYDLTPKAREILSQNADLLLQHSRVKIQIEGHCDERGTIEYNLALGERRANTTKEYLISLGVSPDRVSTISYGEEMPLDPRHNEDAWSKNRRSHFIILSK
ncbi:MAG: peptidoglycan-associated lipoprotein Pal [Thermodesulfobacteriota bacterium]